MQETELWNTRPIEDALNARIAELEALIDQLIAAGALQNARREC
jgi:BMFP domain-containing protein YqiC